jgi:hypothetical protein
LARRATRDCSKCANRTRIALFDRRAAGARLDLAAFLSRNVLKLTTRLCKRFAQRHCEMLLFRAPLRSVRHFDVGVARHTQPNVHVEDSALTVPRVRAADRDAARRDTSVKSLQRASGFENFGPGQCGLRHFREGDLHWHLHGVLSIEAADQAEINETCARHGLEHERFAGTF